MDRKKLVKNYVIFGIGLIFSAFGVALVTKTQLGTSPVTAIPYTMALIIPTVPIGMWTFLLNCLQILVQIVLLGRENKKSELIIQFVLACIYGCFIDFFMMLLKNLSVQQYLGRIVLLLVGCACIAFATYLEVIANVAMLAGDAFIRAITIRFHTEYGITRVVSDTSMVVIAVICGLLCLNAVEGVREGTLIVAIVVGWMIRFCLKHFKKLTMWLQSA